MKFFRTSKVKVKVKQAQFFYLKSPEIIGLYKEDYEIIRDLLPFHFADEVGKFVTIRFVCPFKKTKTVKFYYHYGLKIEFPSLSEKDINSVPHNPSLSNLAISPCSLCNNELYCIFSDTKADFSPKQYDFKKFVKHLQEKGFIESEQIYKEFSSYFYDDYSSESEEVAIKDLLVVFILLMPFILCYLPFHFLGLLFKKKSLSS